MGDSLKRTTEQKNNRRLDLFFSLALSLQDPFVHCKFGNITQNLPDLYAKSSFEQISKKLLELDLRLGFALLVATTSSRGSLARAPFFLDEIRAADYGGAKCQVKIGESVVPSPT